MASYFSSWSERFGPSVPPLEPGGRAGVGARHRHEAVAGVVAERRVEERRVEARDRVVVRVVVVEQRVARADVEGQARADLPRVVDVELEVLPARLRLAEAEGLGEAPGHVLEQEVAQDVAVFAPQPLRPAAPQKAEFCARAVAVRVLVLGVRAGEEARLEEVLAEDGRVVVLQDVEVLVVAEGRLVPERRVAAAAPEDRVPGLVAVLLLARAGRSTASSAGSGRSGRECPRRGR